jgi:hypothetical protein
MQITHNLPELVKQTLVAVKKVSETKLLLGFNDHKSGNWYLLDL